MTDYQERLRLVKSYVKAYDAYAEKRQEVTAFGGEWVRWLRGLCQMSVRKFAAVLEITPSFLSKVENGKEPLSADLARKILDMHGK